MSLSTTPPSFGQSSSVNFSRQQPYFGPNSESNPAEQARNSLVHRGGQLQNLARRTAELAASAAENRRAMQAAAQNQTGGSASINYVTEQPHSAFDAPPTYTPEMSKQFIDARTREAQRIIDDAQGGLEVVQQGIEELSERAQTIGFKKSPTKNEHGFLTRAVEGLRWVGSLFSRSFSFLGKLFPWSWK